MIGGNMKFTIQEITSTQNLFGEDVAEWKDIYTGFGFLDMMTTNSDYPNFNTKMEQSTHVLLCDWFGVTIKPENHRVIVKGRPYEITGVDDPMELHEHMEIYLKYLGGD